jgi:hypothetical protein
MKAVIHLVRGLATDGQASGGVAHYPVAVAIGEVAPTDKVC